ncbi:hypothetical protein HFP65_02120 [Bacillus sp. CB62A.1]
MKKWMKIVLYSLLGILLIGSITFFLGPVYLQPTKEALSLVNDKKMKINSFWTERLKGFFLSRC